MHIRWAAYGFVTALILVLSLSARGVSADESERTVEVQMQNVVYHFTDTIQVHIRKLHGHLVPSRELPVFDDKESFLLQIDTAEIAMPIQSLAAVLNNVVFANSGAPMKGINVRLGANGFLVVKGRLHRKGDIPFESQGRLSATDDGKIRLHIEKVKALHLPVKGLMDLLGVEVSDLLSSGKVTGIKAEKDDLILDPEIFLPPPHIAGHVRDVHLEKDNVVQIIGNDAMPMKIAATNYMAYRGNRLRFGKLTMSDTDMVLIDMDSHDPFDFYLDHYKEQLVAGYTKETPSFGLRVYMRDYNKLSKGKTISAGRRN